MSASPPPYPIGERVSQARTSRAASAAGSPTSSSNSSATSSPAGSSRSSTVLAGSLGVATAVLSPEPIPGEPMPGLVTLGADALNAQYPPPGVPPPAWSGVNSNTPGSSGAGGQLAEELPPSYDGARTPAEQISYTFSHQGGNSMLLLPPPGALDPRPLYHVHVSMNCFVPSMFITTLRRSGPTGELIGEFEMGSSQMTESVSFYGKQKSLSAMMKSTRNKIQGYRTNVWYGRTGPPQPSTPFSLKWTTYDHGSVKTCTLDVADKTPLIVARFTLPPTSPTTDGTPLPPSSITIVPTAFEYQGLVDQIILSALITERYRLR